MHDDGFKTIRNSGIWARNALALLMLSGCSATAVHSTPVSNRASDPRWQHPFALVSPTSWFYALPDEAGERARVSNVPVRRLYPIVVRIAEDHGGSWVRVETVAPSETREQCHEGFPGLSRIQLFLFVHARDLETTTTRQVQVQYDDGTAVTLAAGVVLESAPQFSTPERAIYTAYLDGVMLNTSLPADSVGDRYLASPPFQWAQTPWMLASNAVPRFGGHAAIGEYVPHALGRTIYDRRETRDGTIVTMRSHCGEYRVRVNPAGVLQRDPNDGVVSGLLGALAAHSTGPLAHAGASAYWVDGAPAGVVREEVGFDGELANAHGRRCFLKNLGGMFSSTRLPPNESALRLCFDPGDINENSSAAPSDLMNPILVDADASASTIAADASTDSAVRD